MKFPAEGHSHLQDLILTDGISDDNSNELGALCSLPLMATDLLLSATLQAMIPTDAQ